MLFRGWGLLLFLFLLAPEAQAEYFTIKAYHIQVRFTEEGYADFEEELHVEFSQPRHGIFRFIPYRDDIGGKRVDRLYENIDVEGFRFSTFKENLNQVIKIGDPDKYVNGLQVYKIKYRVVNPLNFFEENTEFYWDLIGTAWEVPIERVEFELIFPEKVILTRDDVRCYTGAAGKTGQDVTYQVSGQSVKGRTNRTFSYGEGMTVAVRLDNGLFQPMSGWRWFLKRHSLLLAPFLFLFGGLGARYYARNRRLTIMTEFFPPEGISPAIAGGFVDHSVDNSDVLSLIPHLANKGYLRMEVEDGKGLFAKDKVTFIRLKEAGEDLLPFEDHFFTALFSSGDRVTLDSLKNKFYVHMGAVQSSVKAWIHNQGWYETGQKKLAAMVGLGGVLAIGWGAWALMARQNPDGLALIGTGILLFYFSTRFHKRSPEGNKTYQRLEGFRKFVARAERPVIERLLKDDPSYYDKTMAYALAFGYLKQWNKMFDGLLVEPPRWYSSPTMHMGGLHQSWNDFSTSFPTEVNRIGSVFSSSPSSSGSGGGGGGGFSGGGSGGGGGGSW